MANTILDYMNICGLWHVSKGSNFEAGLFFFLKKILDKYSKPGFIPEKR